MSKILPTHTCFTDALGHLELIARQAPETLGQYSLVHAICLLPGTVEPYAHGWIEHGQPWRREALQVGILDGVRVVFGVPASHLHMELRVQKLWEYTPAQAYEENRRSGHYGPWVPELVALCRDRQAVAR